MSQVRKVVVFGPQSLNLDPQAVHDLRKRLLHDPELFWAIDVLRDLVQYWPSLVSSLPQLHHLDGGKLLQEIAQWIQIGRADLLTWPLPNILLTPLVVIQHMVDFRHRVHLGAQALGDAHPSRFQPNSGVLGGFSEVSGLCTGLLSAAAVSASTNEMSLAHHGTIAVRLAMLIGAVVDAQDMSLVESERAMSSSVSWSTSKDYQKIEQILQTVPTVSYFTTILSIVPLIDISRG